MQRTCCAVAKLMRCRCARGDQSSARQHTRRRLLAQSDSHHCAHAAAVTWRSAGWDGRTR
eukprot:4090539-Pleurochrysis_carterae.AAC.1